MKTNRLLAAATILMLLANTTFGHGALRGPELHQSHFALHQLGNRGNKLQQAPFYIQRMAETRFSSPTEFISTATSANSRIAIYTALTVQSVNGRR